MNDILSTITNLFEGKEIRSIWDIINALVEIKEPKKYWNDLKRKL